ncbi:MAG: hypothetical protein HY815_08135 [Candidatus Riflebacteria bacterium]|nr:hypothetical protein [Candidatus Riflebacteria bacterium]
MARVDLDPLDEPGRVAHGRHPVRPDTTSYYPLSPLVTHGDLPALTRLEQQALRQLQDAAASYRRDPGNPQALEQTVRGIIERLRPTPASTRNVFVTPDGRPLPAGPVQALPPTPGQPVTIITSEGPILIPEEPGRVAVSARPGSRPQGNAWTAAVQVPARWGRAYRKDPVTGRLVVAPRRSEAPTGW